MSISLSNSLVRVTEVFMKERKHKNSEAINYGDCWLWALTVKTLLKESRLYDALTNYSCGHAFVYYKGKYYDSEMTVGAKNWKELPFFKRYPKEKFKLIYRRPNKFKEVWCNNSFLQTDEDVRQITRQVRIVK